MKPLFYLRTIIPALFFATMFNTLSANPTKAKKDNVKHQQVDLENAHEADEAIATDCCDATKHKKDCTTQKICTIISKVNMLKRQVSLLDEAIEEDFEATLSAFDELAENDLFAQSQLDQCCSTIISKINTLTNIVNMGFDDTFLQLNLVLGKEDTISSKIDLCCLTLNSKLDRLVIGACDLSTISSKLDSCCTTLNSAIGSLAGNVSTNFAGTFTTLSTIENNEIVIIEEINACCATLNSRLDELVVGACDLSTVSSKLDTCCAELNSKIDRLSSGITVISQCDLSGTFTVLNTVLGNELTIESKIDLCCATLNSKLDRLASGITVISQCDLSGTFTVLNTVLGNELTIESKIDLCCATLNSKLDRLASGITVISQCDLSGTFTTLAVILHQEITTQSKIDLCCATLNSKLDRLASGITVISQCDLSGTFTVLNTVLGNESTIASKIDLCCATLNSKIDAIKIIPCDLSGTFTVLNTVINNENTISSKIDLCCATLNSKLDALFILPCDLSTISSKLDVVNLALNACCFTLNSKVDDLDDDLNDCCFTVISKLDAVDLDVNSCCFTLNSKVDDLDDDLNDCCFTVNSKLDTVDLDVNSCCFTLNSKVDDLDADLNDCCATINSKLDAVDSDINSCCSTLNSKVDTLSASLIIVGNHVNTIQSKVCGLALCAATPITTITTISTPGTYCLAQPLAGPIGIGSSAILISASDVVLDLNGYTITCTTGGNGIEIDSTPRTNITIKNGSLNGLSIGGTGIVIDQTTFPAEHKDIKIINVSIRNFSVGILGNNIRKLLIEDCHLCANGEGLLLASSSDIQIIKSMFFLSADFGAILQQCENIQIKCSLFDQNMNGGLRIFSSSQVLIENSFFNNQTSATSIGMSLFRCLNVQSKYCSFSRVPSSTLAPPSSQQYGVNITTDAPTGNISFDHCSFNDNTSDGVNMSGNGNGAQLACVNFNDCQANNNAANGFHMLNNVKDVVIQNCLACMNQFGYKIDSNVPASNEICIIESIAKDNRTTGFEMEGGAGLIKENAATSNTICGFNDMISTSSAYSYVANVAKRNGTNPADNTTPGLNTDSNYCVNGSATPFTPGTLGVSGPFPYFQLGRLPLSAAYWDNMTLP